MQSVSVWHEVAAVALALLPGGLFSAWCLTAVDWRKTWPVLSRGGWLPAVLVTLVLGLVWGWIDRTPGRYLGVAPLPPMLFHVACAVSLLGVALLCGRLQGLLGWTPVEVSLDAPDDHGHGHDGHHDHGHSSHEDTAKAAGPDEPAVGHNGHPH